jgi:hypothetical protein
MSREPAEEPLLAPRVPAIAVVVKATTVIIEQ